MHMSNVEERLNSLGIKLPEPPKPQGNYVGAVTYGNLVYLSGSGPMKDDGSFIVGKVPTDISEEEAYQAARLTGLNLIATLKNHIGDLDRFKKMIKALGMVNCEPDFGAQPKVINGFADLMVEIFGDAGRGARSAVGMGSLPAGIPVEIEMIVEIK